MQFRTIINRGRLITAGVLCLMFLSLEGNSQNTVTFDVDGAETVVPQEVFGVLTEVGWGRQWLGEGSIFIGTKDVNNEIATFGMRTSVLEGFKECGVGAVQFPGGCAANTYDWERSKNPPRAVGVDQFIEFCKFTGAEAMITGLPGNYAASNAAFARYIINDLDYPLKWFKVGNEIWGGCSGRNYVNGYADNFKQNVTAFQDLLQTENGKDLQFIAAAAEVEERYNWIPNWYNQMGSVMDAIEYHDYIFYPGNIRSDNVSEANYWTIMHDVFVGDFHDHLYNQIIPRMREADPSGRIKICFDEWGDWLTEYSQGMQKIQVMDAISAGGHLNQFVHNAHIVGAACLAQGVNAIHSLMNIREDGATVKTPTFYVFKMYKPHHANNAKTVPITASRFDKANSDIPAISTIATVDDSGTVNISFTNCDLRNTREVTVTLNSGADGYKVKSAEVVTGPNYNSTNEFNQPETVNIKTLDASAYSLSGKTLTVTLPSKSVVMVRLALTTAVRSALLSRPGAGYSITAGARGIRVAAAPGGTTPVSVSLFSLDGKTMLQSGTLVSGGTCTLGAGTAGTGVYLVRIVGKDIDLSQKVVLAK